MQPSQETLRYETVTKLSLQPGDILHVKLGGSLGDDYGGDWIPDHQDLADFADFWEDKVPKGVNVIVTHHLVDETVIVSNIRVDTWPPKIGRLNA